uniref:Uncharacterized protein n=1 Tax=Kalanchoe fedtschenkoi TaxID=63787 RepID=A0A7N0VJU8_KALFE
MDESRIPAFGFVLLDIALGRKEDVSRSETLILGTISDIYIEIHPINLGFLLQFQLPSDVRLVISYRILNSFFIWSAEPAVSLRLVPLKLEESESYRVRFSAVVRIHSLLQSTLLSNFLIFTFLGVGRAMMSLFTDL